MSRIFDVFRPVIRVVVRRAWAVVVVAALMTVVGFYFARQLSIDTDFSNLIPSDYASVQALEALRETVGSETTAEVVIRSPSFDANKAFAEAFIPRALELEDPATGEPYLARVDYEKDTEFLERNALYFATSAELDSLERYLRDRIRDAKLEANPFYFDLDDEEDAAEDEGFDIERGLHEVYDQVVGKRYPINDDSTIMVLRFYPTGSQTNIGFIEGLYDDLESLAGELDPASYHAEMDVILAGRLLRQLVEIQAITGDVVTSFAAGVASVLLVVLLYFFYKGYTARAGHRFAGRVFLTQVARTPAMAVLIGAPLLMSLAWTFGVAYLTYGTLNLMTSTLGLVLFGLGIDYGIHFYARYSEERRSGLSVAEAAEVTFGTTGQAIAVGAMTTAGALYVLMLADFRG
ncbi:MAG: MMPL family transporter, partial [Rhodothermales bacterium]